VIVMLHGPYGEDGTIQVSRAGGLPYVGAGVLASAVGMDKATMKAVFSAHGLPIVEYTWCCGASGASGPSASRAGWPRSRASPAS